MLKLKVPPVALTIIFGGMIWLIDDMLSIGDFSVPFQNWLPILLLITAGIVGISGVMEFARKSTTVNPHKPDKASSLVTSGIYSITRNPMYLALLVLLLSWSIYLGNIISFIMLPLFVLYMNEFQIKPEEEVMRDKFGAEFQKYCENVRRWIPIGK